jgi:hypothetical protein
MSTTKRKSMLSVLAAIWKDGSVLRPTHREYEEAGGYHDMPPAIDRAKKKYNDYQGLKAHVPIATNTWVHRDEAGNHHIRYHNTDIMSFAPNGDTTVHCDGWIRSPSTAQRIHAFMPEGAQIASDYRRRTQSNPDGAGWWLHLNGERHEYHDGISFNANSGEILPDNHVRPVGGPVMPPRARGQNRGVDTSTPTDRPSGDYTAPTPRPTYYNSHSPNPELRQPPTPREPGEGSWIPGSGAHGEVDAEHPYIPRRRSERPGWNYSVNSDGSGQFRHVDRCSNCGGAIERDDENQWTHNHPDVNGLYDTCVDRDGDRVPPTPHSYRDGWSNPPRLRQSGPSRPAFTPPSDYVPHGEGEEEPGANYDPERDRREIQQAERYGPDETDGTHYRNFSQDSQHPRGHPDSSFNDDSPAEGEDFAAWMDRTAPAQKPMTCKRCSGSGSIFPPPEQNRTQCPSCKGNGVIAPHTGSIMRPSWQEYEAAGGRANMPDTIDRAREAFNNYRGSHDHMPVGSNTWLHQDSNGNHHVRYYNTDIMSFSPNGDVTINTGGYSSSPRTSSVISRFMPKSTSTEYRYRRAQPGRPGGRSRFLSVNGQEVGEMHDGVSWNYHTGESLPDNHVRPNGELVSPPNGRNRSLPPVRRAPSDQYERISGTPYYRYRGTYGPEYHRRPQEFGENGGNPGEGYDRERDNQELQAADRRQPGGDSYDSGMEWSPDDRHNNFVSDDAPAEGEDFAAWMDRTAPEEKPLTCKQCSGSGSIFPAPEQKRTQCPSCKGNGTIGGTTASRRDLEALSMKYMAGLQQLAFGETVAPSDVDTLRDEECPVCGESSSSFDGKTCQVCGFDAPPVMFRDPDLEKAKALDLRKDEADQGLGQQPGRDGLTPNEQDVNGGMPGEVPGSDVPGSDQMPVDPSMLDENGQPVPGAENEQPQVDPAQIIQQQMEQLQTGVPITPDELGPDGEIIPVQEGVAGDDGMVPDKGGMDLDSGVVEPGALDQDGNTTAPGLNGEPLPGEEQPIDPNGLDPNGVPMASDGQEETVRPGEGAPGTPADGVTDLVCPACGFQADAAQPVSNNMDTQAIPADTGDGTMAGDVCPNCGQAALVSTGEMEQAQQMEQQAPAPQVQASRKPQFRIMLSSQGGTKSRAKRHMVSASAGEPYVSLCGLECHDSGNINATVKGQNGETRPRHTDCVACARSMLQEGRMMSPINSASGTWSEMHHLAPSVTDPPVLPFFE